MSGNASLNVIMVMIISQQIISMIQVEVCESVGMMLVRCGVIWCAPINGGFYAGPILKCVYVGHDTKDVHNNDRYRITSDPRTSTHQIPN